MVSEYVITVGR